MTSATETDRPQSQESRPGLRQGRASLKAQEGSFPSSLNIWCRQHPRCPLACMTISMLSAVLTSSPLPSAYLSLSVPFLQDTSGQGLESTLYHHDLNLAHSCRMILFSNEITFQHWQFIDPPLLWLSYAWVICSHRDSS